MSLAEMVRERHITSDHIRSAEVAPSCTFHRLSQCPSCCNVMNTTCPRSQVVIGGSQAVRSQFMSCHIVYVGLLKLEEVPWTFNVF